MDRTTSPRLDPRLQSDLRDALLHVAIPKVCRVDFITEATRTGDLAADLNCLRRKSSGARQGEEAASPSFVASSPVEVAA